MGGFFVVDQFIGPLGLGPGPEPGPEHTNGTYMELSVNTAGAYMEQIWNVNGISMGLEGAWTEHQLKHKKNTN